MWMYFFKRLHPLTLQNTQFGLANYVGLMAAILFAMLLLLSNDISLRSLGTRRWKWLQRWTYVAFVLTIVHGIIYQLIEKRHLPWVLFFSALTAAVLAAQTLGYLRTQRRTPGR
jgi:sulfoxide reductase heme-binding subunit YedZ